jgi:DNA-binding NarL/FixJ family response regulator
MSSTLFRARAEGVDRARTGAYGHGRCPGRPVADGSQLVAALEAVAAGRSVVDPTVVESLVAVRVRNEESPLAELTPRELEILADIAQGMSNQAIADHIVVTKRAVEKHINAIFLKLGLTESEDVSRRVKAALIYLARRPEASAA